MWIQVHLYKTLSFDDAKIALDTLISVFNGMHTIRDVGALSVLEMASKEELTYYDAAYLQAAADRKMTLVTDDLVANMWSQ